MTCVTCKSRASCGIMLSTLGRRDMTWTQICAEAGLGITEIALVETYIEDDDGRFLETKAYEKLFTYFCDIGDMPLRVAKAKDLEPDIWILDRLAACKSERTMV
jgi:hypothetical protein